VTVAVSPEQDGLKRIAAASAVEEVEDGMVVGLGSGSTAGFAIEALGARVARGLRIAGIPTSERTAALARRFGVPLTSFAERRRIDLAIDGADEVERDTLHLIKGLGGALLREKIVAASSARMIVVVDESKIVDRLGSHLSLPVVIVRFGWQSALDRLTAAGMRPRLRTVGSEPFVTDDGHYVADCAVIDIPDPAALERRLTTLIGVVESGLFIGLASKVIVGSVDGVTALEKRVPIAASVQPLRSHE
jgi:ribose 5-phosphate isomerase A